MDFLVVATIHNEANKYVKRTFISTLNVGKPALNGTHYTLTKHRFFKVPYNKHFEEMYLKYRCLSERSISIDDRCGGHFFLWS
jgi:hypothetical protein